MALLIRNCSCSASAKRKLTFFVGMVGERKGEERQRINREQNETEKEERDRVKHVRLLQISFAPHGGVDRAIDYEIK